MKRSSLMRTARRVFGTAFVVGRGRMARDRRLARVRQVR